jgi:predicted nucleotidyltransferase component of viral defense system
MSSFDSWNEEDRRAFLQKAVPLTTISEVILEKDYWVTWVLKRIFSLSEISKHIIFKGGTSLSKAFGLIKRFSEDIDVSFDRHFLGFDESKDPQKAASNSKREQLLKDISLASGKYVKEVLLPLLQTDFEKAGINGSWKLEIDPEEGQNILFYYPRGLIRSHSEYITSYVKIEFGARSDPWPVEDKYVKSHLAELFPKEVAEEQKPKIKVLSVERTFWEKVTILHAEYHRPEGKVLPIRHSRHFYDLFEILKSPYANSPSKSLLERVVAHKQIFFRSSWANYSSATLGSLKLLPRKEQMPALQEDYSKMKEMFFDEPVEFNKILESIGKFEELFNSGK